MSPAVHREFARQPALDGVRAIAVALVLLFHQGWLSGGYVGVSVFFTLSGYLITSLALVEHDRTGRLDVRAFYGRRIKRLLPASLACIVGVVVLALTGVFSDVEHLRRDLWGALAQVYNWVALGGDQSYAQLVGGDDVGRSPLDHYWSLAIEEQFYWVWPLVLVVVLRSSARGRVVWIGAATVVFAVAAPVIAGTWGGDAAYWATPARFAEILVGAALAAVLRARRGRPLPRALAMLAPASLAAIVAAAVLWPSSTGPAYEGWLPVFALASTGLVLGLQVRSRWRSLLSSPPLVVLGSISYGVYLFHWPVFVVLDAERTELPAVPLFVLRMIVTLGLAVVSFRHLESPVRRARPRRMVVPVGAVSACAAVAAAVVLVPGAARPYWLVASAAPPDSVVLDATGAPATLDVAPLAAPEPSAPATVPATAPPPSAPPAASPAVPAVPALPASPPFRPVRLLVVGDSTAMATTVGLDAFEDAHDGFLDVVSAAAPGCGMIADGMAAADPDDLFGSRCRTLRADTFARLPRTRPDVVLGMVTLTDAEPRTWDAAEGPLDPSDPRFRARLVDDYDEAASRFLAGGATDVVWVVPPPPETADADGTARAAHYAEALREVAARRPGQVSVVDLHAWVAAQPEPLDRPDGLHWSREAATRIAEELLGPIVVAAGLA